MRGFGIYKHMKTLKITLQSGQRAFFTSDLHLNHANILKFARTWIPTIEAHEAEIIQKWNAHISKNDIVFILGDVFWKSPKDSIESFFAKLKFAKVYIIPGNHDSSDALRRMGNIPNVEVCTDITLLWLTTAENKTYRLYMCHYPLMTWPRRDHWEMDDIPTYNLFGHIHSGPNAGSYDSDLPLWKGDMLDVGLDSNHLCPYSFDDVLKKLDDEDPI